MYFQLRKQTFFLLPAVFFALAITGFSEFSNKEDKQIVIAPSCFVQNTSLQHKELAKVDDFLLILAKRTHLEAAREIKSQTVCGFYRDVTPELKKSLEKNQKKMSPQFMKSFGTQLLSEEILALKQNDPPDKTPKEYVIKYPTEIQKILSSFVSERMWADLQTLTSFQNRYPNSEHGLKAAEWLKTQAEAIAQSSGRSDIKVEFIKTGTSYKQPSVLMTVPGSNPDLEGVLLGGHFDTLNGTRPGADDDGSGTVTVLEVARTVLNSNSRFKRTMYFVWYAAEEQGLVGSQYVSKFFVKNKIPLVGVLQFDMTGYQAKSENKIWILDDYVDKSLTTFVTNLAVNYAKVEVGHTRCGYACSDHASWTSQGYRAAATFETKFGSDNPNIHTQNDTIHHLSLEHMSRFGIVGVAFMGELAEPESNEH